ncbi:CPBP family intramembrane metalloprotease [Rossellomorea aquimaris]|uniref:CPBP family intramembrane glutamic endopeptidase n=1 Tax=Rossellomorea aquimaris TaxID=189382 RepID=UPI001CD315F0|nr:type II CAAX endopeptidase family protein [Rossellomorea aquimaris]MCA1056127.1 CPBP family intramembrane metalloprotease [Rossellomorea aquimaris]
MNHPYKQLDEKRPLLEMGILVVLMVIVAIFFPAFKGAAAILPIIYVFIERRVRNRSLSSIGFKREQIGASLKKKWQWVLIVGVVFQLGYFFLLKQFVPEVFGHIHERVSILDSFDTKLIFSILILALGEEIVFRGLIQNRLNWVMNPLLSISLTSILFTIMHISSGPPGIVIPDLITIFLDSLVFGYLYYKSGNLYLSWIAHALANVTAAFLMFQFL